MLRKILSAVAQKRVPIVSSFSGLKKTNFKVSPTNLFNRVNITSNFSRKFSSSSNSEDEDKLVIYKLDQRAISEIHTAVRLGVLSSLASIGFGSYFLTFDSALVRWAGIFVAIFTFLRSASAVYTISSSPIQMVSVWPRTSVTSDHKSTEADEADEELSGEALYETNHPEFLDITTLSLRNSFGSNTINPAQRSKVSELTSISKAGTAVPYLTEESLEILRAKRGVGNAGVTPLIFLDKGAKTGMNTMFILNPLYVTHLEAFNQVINAGNKNQAELTRQLVSVMNERLSKEQKEKLSKEFKIDLSNNKAAEQKPIEENFDYINAKRQASEAEVEEAAQNDQKKSETAEKPAEKAESNEKK